MFKRKPYRKDKEYFYHVSFMLPSRFSTISGRGIITPRKHLSEEEMHLEVLRIVVDTITSQGTKITCSFEELAVTFYRIQEN